MIVWIASYPRSGNTFLRVILNNMFNIKTYSIYNDINDIGSDKSTSETVGHEFLPCNFDIQKMRVQEEVFYIKTHDLLDLRINDEDKVFYLIRDGRESTLSYEKYLNNYFSKESNVVDTINGNSFAGAWGDHVTSWSPETRKNTLLIKFEELIKEPTLFIDRIADFINQEPIDNNIPSFTALKEINPKFFREGKVNSWEKSYSEYEHFTFWMKNHEQMIQFGYTNKMPKMVSENPQLFREISNQSSFLLKEVSRLTQSVDDKNNYLNDKDILIQAKDKLLGDKDKLLGDKDKLLGDKDKLLGDKDKLLGDKDKLLGDKDKLLGDKNKLITNQKEMVDQLSHLLREEKDKIEAIYQSKKYKLAMAISYPYRSLYKMKNDE